jgi:hypothetical protein
MFLGITLALETQARVYFVHEHARYNGFVLLGEGFTVVAQGCEFLPVSAENVKKDLADISLHHKALEGITKLLSECTIGKSRKRVVVKVEDITTNRALYDAYHQRKVSETEKEEIEKLVNDLSFPERYWKPSPESLEKVLNAYIHNEGLHGADAPMYISQGLISSVDHSFRALSVFGPTAPSFFTINGDKRSIPVPSKPDPLSAINPETGRAELAFVPYTMKSIKTSMNDLYKVFKDQAIYILPRERAGPSRTTQFKDNARNKVWQILRETIGEHGGVETPEKSGAILADKKEMSEGKKISFGDDLDFD